MAFYFAFDDLHTAATTSSYTSWGGCGLCQGPSLGQTRISGGQMPVVPLPCAELAMTDVG